MYKLTLDGVDIMGERLAEEVGAIFQIITNYFSSSNPLLVLVNPFLGFNLKVNFNYNSNYSINFCDTSLIRWLRSSTEDQKLERFLSLHTLLVDWLRDMQLGGFIGLLEEKLERTFQVVYVMAFLEVQYGVWRL